MNCQTTLTTLFIMCISFCKAQNSDGRWKLEVRSISCFPLKSEVVEESYFGTGAGFQTKVRPRVSAGVEISSSYVVYEWSVGKSDWYFGLELGAGVGMVILNSNIDSYEYYDFHSGLHSSHEVFASTSVQTDLFVDNLAIFTHKGRKLETQVGINLRTGYLFYIRWYGEGSVSYYGAAEYEDYTETWHQAFDPIQSLDFYRSNYAVQAVFRFRPVAVKGFYSTLRLPLHPAQRWGYAQVPFYDVYLGLGYEFQR